MEARAKEICGVDESCLFDIAATKNEDIGMATMMGVMDFDMIVESAEPSKHSLYACVQSSFSIVTCKMFLRNISCFSTDLCSISLYLNTLVISPSSDFITHAVICDPPCDKGVCVDTNSCSCAVGYSGERCTERS